MNAGSQLSSVASEREQKALFVYIVNWESPYGDGFMDRGRAEQLLIMTLKYSFKIGTFFSCMAFPFDVCAPSSYLSLVHNYLCIRTRNIKHNRLTRT